MQKGTTTMSKEVFKCAHSDIIEIHKIVLNPKNTNEHPQEQIELLAKIIDFQGQRSPIVISKRSGYVVKGEGRYLSMLRLGWEKVAVDYQDYDSEAQEYADLEADNNIQKLAVHNFNKMVENAKTLDIKDLPAFDVFGIPNFTVNLDNIVEPNLTDLNDKESAYNFIIKCENKDQLEMLQQYFHTDGSKVKYEKVKDIVK